MNDLEMCSCETMDELRVVQLHGLGRIAFQVHCGRCESRGSAKPSEHAARKAWNSAHAPREIVRRLGGLLGEIMAGR